jgi:hypothetical protein
MTFDPVMGDYFGGATCTGTKCTLSASGDGKAASMGGMVSILAGTGAGQYRRLVGFDATGHVITIDKPFTTPLDATSMMQLGPFKGRFIFDENRYEDCGAFQLVRRAPAGFLLLAAPFMSCTISDQKKEHHRLLNHYENTPPSLACRVLLAPDLPPGSLPLQYANAADVIVSRHKFARAEGLLSWGRAGGGHVYAPNIRVQFVDNVVEEANHMWNWNATCESVSQSVTIASML